MSDKEPGFLARLTVNIKITIAVVLFVLSVALIAMYVCFPGLRDELIFATAIFGGSAAIYTGYYTAASLKLNLARDKRAASFQIIDKLNHVDRAKVRHLIDIEISNKNIAPQQLYEKIISDPILLAGITELLGIFEDTSLAIQHGHADEDILFFALDFLVIWSYFGLEHYITEERRRNDNPRLYIETKKIAHAWRDKKSLMSGKGYQV